MSDERLGSGALPPKKAASPSRFPSEPGGASVNALIRDFASILRAAAGGSLELELGLPDSVDRVAIDSTQFKVALLNLVANVHQGLHAADGLAISTQLIDDPITASPPLEPGLYAAICISHRECGISLSASDRVCDPFFDGHASRRNVGLGLSQVYGFAMQSHGGIGIDTPEREGTRVTIYLPLMAPAGETDGGGGLGVASGTRTVLLVDDDEHVRGSTSDAIEMLGYRVIAEASVVDALARLRSEPGIDILFTDIVLARGTSGVELAREARALRPELRILLASGHARESLGADGGDGFAFLAKPYRLQELGAALKSLGAGES